MYSFLVQTLEKQINFIFMNPLSILPFFLFVFFLYKWLSTSSSTLNRNLPPSPPKLPVLGHLHQLGKYPHISLQSLSKRYGDLMLIYLGQKPTLVVSSASAVKEIMKTHDAVMSNRPKSSIADRLLYNSRDVAAAPYGEYWRQMKSLFLIQLLSNRRVKSFRTIREEETALLVDKIMQSKSSVLNMSDMFVDLTNDVICRVVLGRKYSGDLQDGTEFKELLGELVQLLGVPDVGGLIPWLAWVDKLTGLDKKLDKVSKRFDLLLEQILNEHLAEIDTRQGKYNETEGSEESKDFVDVLFEVQRENAAGFPIEKDSIKALLLDVFGGGTHTSTTVIEWVMTELLRHPEVMKKLQEEARGITRDKEDITQEDLQEMKYLKAVIKETLRLHPPIPLLVPRESTQDVKVKGYDIPAKTMVIINAWTVHRDPLVWEEHPEEFRPERFLNSPVDYKGHHFELIPFGGGRRICPGILFAIANNELVLAHLVRKFNWALPAGVTAQTLDMSQCIGLTIRRNTPLRAVATPYVY